MPDRLFIDTWGWIVLYNKREPRHKEVNTFYRKFRLHGGKIYTSDYVLDETFTLLFKRVAGKSAADALRLIQLACTQGYVEIVPVSPKVFEKAIQLRLKLHDKPGISFTDLTSMLVMKGQGIPLILTEDDHFSHVGMSFTRPL
ncbi:MAG: type II toxin-antitoxin system VapC family toxin [Nitrospirae bacterium]|nr:type II toxin-antitoxin system VapC family toxin [Nitrospirota bacterium]